MMDEHTVDLLRLAALLADAFVDDPGMAYLCQHQRDGYEARLAGWFLAMLRLHVANRQPILSKVIDGEIAACAVLTMPEANLRAATLIRWTWDCTRLSGLYSLLRTLDHLRLASQHRPDEPHFRLEFIAVAPSHQGKGYGSELLRRIHELVDADTSADRIWLETANPDNEPFYVRFGYATIANLPIGSQAQTVIMLRCALTTAT